MGEMVIENRSEHITIKQFFLNTCRRKKIKLIFRILGEKGTQNKQKAQYSTLVSLPRCRFYPSGSHSLTETPSLPRRHFPLHPQSQLREVEMDKQNNP